MNSYFSFVIYILFLILYLYAFINLIQIPKALWLVALNFILLLYQPFVKSKTNRYYISIIVFIIFIVQAIILIPYNKSAAFSVIPYAILYGYQNLIANRDGVGANFVLIG